MLKFNKVNIVSGFIGVEKDSEKIGVNTMFLLPSNLIELIKVFKEGVYKYNHDLKAINITYITNIIEDKYVVTMYNGVEVYSMIFTKEELNAIKTELTK